MCLHVVRVPATVNIHPPLGSTPAHRSRACAEPLGLFFYGCQGRPAFSRCHAVRERHIAILIDGGFFLKRLPDLVSSHRTESADALAGCLRQLCKSHVRYLTGADNRSWYRHLYRIFYYDAAPYDGKAHHPIDNQSIDFAKSDVAERRRAFFAVLRRQRKLALRLGKVTRDHGWVFHPAQTKALDRGQPCIRIGDRGQPCIMYFALLSGQVPQATPPLARCPFDGGEFCPAAFVSRAARQSFAADICYIGCLSTLASSHPLWVRVSLV